MIQSLDLGANENKLLLGLAEKARKAATRRRKRAASRKGSRQDSIPNTTSTYWRSTSFQCETAGIGTNCMGSFHRNDSNCIHVIFGLASIQT